jgi:hypothetical protein
MSRNGSGIYSLATGNPVVTGATISSTWANASLSDIATALTGSIASDGQTTVTNNLPMGNYAHTGVATATVRTMYATAGQAQDSAFTFLTSPAGTNTMTAIASLGMSTYVTGQRFFFVAPTTNTGACTLNINAIGIKSITKLGTTALVAGDVISGAIIQVVYDGTEFQLLNPPALPSGVITMWSGSIASIPGGWYLCDGTNGTPNLRDRFIVGAGSTYAVNATGGSADAVVVSHSHTATSTVTDPSHAHRQQGYTYTSAAPGGGTPLASNYSTTDMGATTSVATGITVNTTVSTTGVSGTNANLPPYFALAYIMKA